MLKQQPVVVEAAPLGAALALPMTATTAGASACFSKRDHTCVLSWLVLASAVDARGRACLACGSSRAQ